MKDCRYCAGCVDGDESSLHAVATALTRLQTRTGPIPRVCGVGPAAQRVHDLMEKMSIELGKHSKPAQWNHAALNSMKLFECPL